MLIDPEEAQSALSFFQKHKGKDLRIALSIFDGFAETQTGRITAAGRNNEKRHHVQLTTLDRQRQFDIDLDRYSFVTISSDGTAIELRRLLGGSGTFSLLISTVE